eukprot:g18710.t1
MTVTSLRLTPTALVSSAAGTWRRAKAEGYQDREPSEWLGRDKTGGKISIWMEPEQQAVSVRRAGINRVGCGQCGLELIRV